MLSQFYHYYQRQRDSGEGRPAPSPHTGPLNHKNHHPQEQQQLQPQPRPMAQINWREAALRRRKVADCQIIGCVITSGLLILGAGLGMFLAAWFVLGKDDPFILIGPVFAGCGIVVLLLSVEVCVRRQKVIKLTEDLSSDEEGDGHYIDEGLINYGFGHFQGDPVPGVLAKSPAHHSPIVVKPQPAGGDYKPSFDVEGRLRPEDRPDVNILAPTPDMTDVLDVSMTQETIELMLSPQGGRG